MTYMNLKTVTRESDSAIICNSTWQEMVLYVRPDIQYHFLPGAITYDGTVAFSGHGFQVHVGHNKPTSRGSVTVTSSDIKVHPKIHFNYLSTESDRALSDSVDK